LPPNRAGDAIRGYYRSGLLLAPYFYEALEAYEQNSSSLTSDSASIAGGISYSAEEDRFRRTFQSISIPEKPALRAEVPVPPPPPPVNPVRDLLKTAESAFNSKDDARALEAFKKVLSDFDPNNGPAFYGIGLIASRAGNSDQSKQSFDRALRSDS